MKMVENRSPVYAESARLAHRAYETADVLLRELESPLLAAGS